MQENTQTKFIARPQMQTILDNAPQGVDKKALIDKFVSNGYTVEGVNDKKETTISDKLSQRGSNMLDIAKNTSINPLSRGLQGVGQMAGAVGDVIGSGIGAVAGGVDNLTDNVISNTAKSVLRTPLGQEGLRLAHENADAYNTWKKANPEIAGNLEAVVNIASILPVGKAASVAKEGVLGTADMAVQTGKGIMADVKNASTLLPAGMKSPEIAAQILTKQVRLTPTQRSTFSAMSGGLDEGQYLVKKGIYEPNDQAIKSLGEDWLKSYNEKKTALGQLGNQYTFAPVNEALKELVDYETKTAVKGTKGLFTDRINELSKAAETRGLTLNEIDDLKNAYERTVALGYGKEVNTTGTAKATKIDNALKTFIETEAEKQGFTNVKELNKNTQLSRFLADAIENRVGSRAGNNFVGLSDTIMATGAVVDPKALALLAVKKTLGSEAVQSRIAKYLGKTIPTEIKANVTESTPALLNPANAPKTDFIVAPSGSKTGQFESATKKIATSGQKRTQDIPQAKSQLISPLKESVPQTTKKASGEVIPKELLPLAEEARKYKSAEDFINAQEGKYYHGGDKIDEYKNIGEGGVYLTPDLEMAEIHKKFINWKTKGERQGVINEGFVKPKKTLILNENQVDIIEAPKFYKKAIDKIKKDGYDSIMSHDKKQLFVFDATKVKTKKQLEDIWEQANKN